MEGGSRCRIGWSYAFAAGVWLNFHCWYFSPDGE